MLALEVMPTLAFVLHHVAERIDVPEEGIIAGRGDGADEARDLFCWLATMATELGADLVGAAFGADADEAGARRRAVEARRGTDGAYARALLDELVAVQVTAALARRSLLRAVPEREAAATARRILTGPRQVLSVPVADLVHLAAAHLSLIQQSRRAQRRDRLPLDSKDDTHG